MRLAPRSATLRAWASTSSAIWKWASVSKPRAFFNPATSSPPSLAPWMPPVLALVGEGQPMMVRSEMIDGRVVSAFAARIAASSSFMSST